VRRTPVLLGAILLDLLAVLFGGAVALLPVFARSILHVGPEGLGVLRAAPAVGALLAAALMTRRPLLRKAGRKLLLVVGVYGASIVVFGLSRDFALSLIMLAIGGFADMFSMNIRSTTSALATPDRLRGRVSAVEMVFISASNQLVALRIRAGRVAVRHGAGRRGRWPDHGRRRPHLGSPVPRAGPGRPAAGAQASRGVRPGP
jgi:hypothetical protein